MENALPAENQILKCDVTVMPSIPTFHNASHLEREIETLVFLAALPKATCLVCGKATFSLQRREVDQLHIMQNSQQKLGSL